MRMACAWLAEMKVHQTGLRWRERKCASTCTCLAKLSKTPVMSAMAWWCLMYGHTLPWSVPERLTPLCSICRELLERQNASQLSRINLFFGNFLDFAAVAFHTLSRSAHRLLWFTSMAEFTSIFMYFPHSTSALYLGFPQCIAHLDTISHSRSNLWRVSAEVMFQMRALAARLLLSCFLLRLLALFLISSLCWSFRFFASLGLSLLLPAATSWCFRRFIADSLHWQIQDVQYIYTYLYEIAARNQEKNEFPTGHAFASVLQCGSTSLAVNAPRSPQVYIVCICMAVLFSIFSWHQTLVSHGYAARLLFNCRSAGKIDTPMIRLYDLSSWLRRHIRGTNMMNMEQDV